MRSPPPQSQRTNRASRHATHGGGSWSIRSPLVRGLSSTHGLTGSPLGLGLCGPDAFAATCTLTTAETPITTALAAGNLATKALASALAANALDAKLTKALAEALAHALRCGTPALAAQSPDALAWSSFGSSWRGR